LFVPTFSAKWRTSWVLVMPEAMNPPLIESFDFPAILAYYTMAPVEKQRPNPHFKRLFFMSEAEVR
jgi:hypothetical protein